MTDLLTPNVPQTPARQSRGRWWLVIGLLLIVLAAGAVTAARWRTSLDVLGGAGQDATMPVHVGDAVYVDAGLGPVPDRAGNAPDSVTVTIDALTAGGTLETTTATTSGTFTDMTFVPYVCVRIPRSDGIGITPAADLAKSCSSVTSLIAPATLNLGFTTTQIIYKVDVASVGTYQLAGVVVDYHSGLRHGMARVPAHIDLVATR